MQRDSTGFQTGFCTEAGEPRAEPFSFRPDQQLLSTCGKVFKNKIFWHNKMYSPPFFLVVYLSLFCLFVSLLFAFFPQRISQETLCLALSQFPCCGPHSVSVCLASDASVLRLEGWKVTMALYYQTFSFICAAFKHRDSVGSLGKGCWGN